MKITATALCLLVINTSLYAREPLHIESVTPNFVKMQHSAKLDVKITGQSESTELSIIPGGVYMESIEKLPPGKQQLLNRNYQPEIFNEASLKRNFDLVRHTLDLNLVTQIESADLYSNDKPINHWSFSKPIVDASLSNESACFVLNDNSLIYANFNDNQTLSAIPNAGITTLAQIENHCITADKNHLIQIWGVINKKLAVLSSFKLNNVAHKIIVEDNLLLIANGQTGLTVLEMDEQLNLHWASSYNKLGNILQLANSGSEVIVADDEGILTLIDISGANRPLLISDFFLGKTPESLIYINGNAFALADNTLFTVNFKSHSSPLISTQGVNQGGSRRSFIDKEILYVADWFSGLHLYDISQPHALRHISTYHTPGSPKGVLVRNDLAYVADDDHGLQILDVKNPRFPRLLANLPLEGLAYTMKLSGNILYVASHYGGFHLIDITIANQPKLISSVNTPGKAWALALKGTELYVADDTTGLLVFDVSNPVIPTMISQFNPGGFVEDVVIRGNRAYLAFFDLGLYILDISDANAIRIIASLKTPGSARGIEIHNDILYLASWEAGVTLIDIKHEEQPQLISQYDTDGATWGLSVKNNTVYAMDWWGGIKVVDATQPQNVRQIAKYHAAGTINDIVLQGNFIYTAHGSRGLQIYEASNALNPVWASGVDFNGNASAVAVENNLAMIATEDSGINFVDISNSFQPHWISRIDLRANIIDIVSNQNYAYALSEDNIVFILDLHNPTHPAIETRLPIKAKQIQFYAGHLWCLSNTDELVKFDITDMQHIKQLQSINLNYSTKSFHIDRDTIFLAGINNELVKYSIINDMLDQKFSLQLDSAIIDILPLPEKLLVTTANRTLNVIQNTSNWAVTEQYSSTHQIKKMAGDARGIYFSGESQLASGQLLPPVQINKIASGFEVNIPQNMPLATYHMKLRNTDGTQSTLLNAFEIGFPKLKPKFTLEDLQKKLRDPNLAGKASVKNNDKK